MNEKPAYAFRIVLGGFLAYLGIKLIYQMVKEQPTNMMFIGAMGAVFVIIGGSYAIYSFKKFLDIRKSERDTIEPDLKEESEGIKDDSDIQNIPQQLNMQETEMKKTVARNTEENKADDAKEKSESQEEDMTEQEVETDGEKESGERVETEEEIENDYEEK